MDIPYTFSWVEQTAERIYESPTFRQSLTVVASNLSDLLDSLIPIVEPGSLLESQHTSFLKLKIKEWQMWGSPLAQETLEHVYFLETARDIFDLYESSPQMADWELEYEGSQIFVSDFDLGADKEDAIRITFAYSCAHFQGWLESEITNPVARELKQLTFETREFYRMTPSPDD